MALSFSFIWVIMILNLTSIWVRMILNFKSSFWGNMISNLDWIRFSLAGTDIVQSFIIILEYIVTNTVHSVIKGSFQAIVHHALYIVFPDFAIIFDDIISVEFGVFDQIT